MPPTNASTTSPTTSLFTSRSPIHSSQRTTIVKPTVHLCINNRYSLFLASSHTGKSSHHIPASRDELIQRGNSSLNASFIWKESWMASKAVVKVKTFQIIILQGIVGSLPWNTMVFFTIWFSLIGFDHNYTATLLSLFAARCTLGSSFGGMVTDRVAHIYPHSGGIICAQFSAFMGISFSWFLLNYVVTSVPKTFVLIMESKP